MTENIQLVLSNYETRYSDLSVFIDREESEFYVYLGVALLERISIDAEEIGHKMFIGRLYNSGVKLCILRDRFGHDNRTVKKWGNALKTCDVDEMSKAFTGRKAAKKTTPELIRYILQQYNNRSVLGRSYREKIIMGGEEVFAVHLSASLISQISRRDSLITWEKGFDGSGWNENKSPAKFIRHKRKNGSSGKKKKYSFECQESPWSKMSGIRRIIVKATNHNGDTIIVSVLCSNPEMPLEDVVWLIFNRWLQENDFKYLDRHFGIDQLDSRAHGNFKNKMDEFTDRSAESMEYKN